MTHEELIMHHHEDIKKVKEMLKDIPKDLDAMLKNIPKDLDAVFRRLDTLERQTDDIYDKMEAQVKFYKSWIKLLEDMDNG